MSSWKSSSVSSGLLMIFLMMPTLIAFYGHTSDTCRRDYAHTSPQGDGREVQREGGGGESLEGKMKMQEGRGREGKVRHRERGTWVLASCAMEWDTMPRPLRWRVSSLQSKASLLLVVLGMGTRGSSREGSNWSSWCSSGTISRASPEQWKVVGRTYHLITLFAPCHVEKR